MCRPRAVRAAEKLKSVLGVDAELVAGGAGEFTVWVDGQKVAEKGWIRFPSNEKIISAVKAAL